MLSYLTYILSGILMGTLAMWVMGGEEEDDLAYEDPDRLLPLPMEE